MDNARSPVLKNSPVMLKGRILSSKRKVIIIFFVTRNDGQSPQVNDSKQYSLSRVFCL